MDSTSKDLLVKGFIVRVSYAHIWKLVRCKIDPYPKAKLDLMCVCATYTWRCGGQLDTEAIHLWKSERSILHQDNFHVWPKLGGLMQDVGF